MKHLALFVLILTGCTKEPPLPEKVTYSEHIRPIVQQRCMSCHGALQGRNWLIKENLVNAKDKVLERVVRNRTMPPGGLPDYERRMFARWILQGAK